MTPIEDRRPERAAGMKQYKGGDRRYVDLYQVLRRRFVPMTGHNHDQREAHEIFKFVSSSFTAKVLRITVRRVTHKKDRDDAINRAKDLEERSESRMNKSFRWLENK